MPEKLQSRMSSPTSIWLRSIRYLTHEGKPLPRLAPVFIKSTTELLLPFAIMTQTDNNRLICWPVLPKDAPLESEKGRLIDHITLELTAERDGLESWQPQVRQLDRAGYGLRYGNYYGGL